MRRESAVPSSLQPLKTIRFGSRVTLAGLMETERRAHAHDGRQDETCFADRFPSGSGMAAPPLWLPADDGAARSIMGGFQHATESSGCAGSRLLNDHAITDSCCSRRSASASLPQMVHRRRVDGLGSDHDAINQAEVRQ